MKQLTTYNRTVQYLNKVFKLINAEYFNGNLETPTITVQSTLRAYGHLTVSKVWKNGNGQATYELNISADYLNRPIDFIVATLIHECCHLYNLMNGIQDTSNNGIYHNKKFKAVAEQSGLIVERHPRYGWSVTSPSDETVRFCVDNGLREILCTRDAGFSFFGIGTDKAASGSPDKAAKKKGNSIKWVCPCCGTIIRSTKAVNVICGDCGVQFEQA